MEFDKDKINHLARPGDPRAAPAKQADASTRGRLITRDDLSLLASCAVAFPIAWALPERWWPTLATAISGLTAPLRRGNDRKTIDALNSIFGARIAPTLAASLVRRHHTLSLIEAMQHLRGHRPGGWTPRIELIGSEHVNAALRDRTGAVLWVTDFIFSTLVTKIALRRAGYAVVHLSRPGHPLSDSRLGRRLLNPIVTRLETRYLEKRVVIDEGETTAGMRVLLRHVGSNGVISITVGNESRQTLRVPILDGYIHLAKGAPRLAVSARAPLLPVFTLPREDGGFTTTIDAPLAFSREGSPEDVSRRAMEEYVKRLEPRLIEAPHLWYDWSELITPRSAP